MDPACFSRASAVTQGHGPGSRGHTRPKHAKIRLTKFSKAWMRLARASMRTAKSLLRTTQSVRDREVCKVPRSSWCKRASTDDLPESESEESWEDPPPRLRRIAPLCPTPCQPAPDPVPFPLLRTCVRLGPNANLGGEGRAEGLGRAPAPGPGTGWWPGHAVSVGDSNPGHQ